MQRSQQIKADGQSNRVLRVFSFLRLSGYNCLHVSHFKSMAKVLDKVVFLTL